MKPILFNTAMVQAILEGRKTTTRRIVKVPKYIKKQDDGLYTILVEDSAYINKHFEETIDYIKKPYEIGDILYVRETWQISNPIGDFARNDRTAEYVYKAGYAKGKRIPINIDKEKNLGVWKPSIHMPKDAARIFLKVTSVKVEKLQDITEDGAKTEGANPQLWYQPYRTKNEGQQRYVGDMTHQEINYRTGFAQIWDNTLDIHDKLAWQYTFENNPWVWVIEFERMSKSEVESNEFGM